MLAAFFLCDSFLSKIDRPGHRDWPAWMGATDLCSLRLKRVGSVAAISAVQLRKELQLSKGLMHAGTASDRDSTRCVMALSVCPSSVLVDCTCAIAGKTKAASAPVAAVFAQGAP